MTDQIAALHQQAQQALNQQDYRLAHQCRNNFQFPQNLEKSLLHRFCSGHPQTTSRCLPYLDLAIDSFALQATRFRG